MVQQGKQNRIRIVLINNYPMDEMWRLWETNESPGHHLWGATHFSEHGLELVILPHSRFKFLKRLSQRKLVSKLGDLDQQVRLFFQQSDYEVVYSGVYTNTALLALIRSIGLFNRPIVVIAHNSPVKNLFNSLYVRLFLGNHDKILCLSNQIETELKNNYNIPPRKLQTIEWAVDYPYYDKICHTLGEGRDSTSFIQDSPPYFITTGTSRRDYNTLLEAFKQSNAFLKIYAWGRKLHNPPFNVFVGNKALSFASILEQYLCAYAVLIPLDIPRTLEYSIGLSGVSSLFDALALGKAVIMTRNKLIDLDIEKEGIGIYVSPHDVIGWVNAVSYFSENPEEVAEMGKRARAVCESRYSLAERSSDIARVLTNVSRSL